MEVKYGTRGSKLALHQTRLTIDIARKAVPEVKFEEVIIKTLGDNVTDMPLFKIGGQGLFIKEIEQALQNRNIDIAIHSLKDVPHSMSDGLSLLAVGGCEDPRDCFISDKYSRLSDLPIGAVIGTSSLRRRVQLRALRDDLKFNDMRGNLDTRLKKLSDGEVDAIILAAAGLNRFGWQNKIKHHFSIDELLPPAGQGILAIQCRSEDLNTLLPLFSNFSDHEATVRAIAERTFLKILQGGCSTPMAVNAAIDGEKLTIKSFVGSLDSSCIIRKIHFGKCSDAEALGQQAAKDMLSAGAGDLLKN